MTNTICTFGIIITNWIACPVQSPNIDVIAEKHKNIEIGILQSNYCVKVKGDKDIVVLTHSDFFLPSVMLIREAPSRNVMIPFRELLTNNIISWTNIIFPN